MRYVLTVVALILPLNVRADGVTRLEREKLQAVHKAIEALRTDWRKVPRSGPFKDYRANLHVHSALSHDSRGTIDEIVKAAKSTGTQVLMFTEHPADHFDILKDGHKGLKNGVLLIPGAETRGFLAFPKVSLRGLEGSTPQEFADLVRSRGGLMFLSHLEERMDWEIRGLTGVEIYNTHANFKSQKRLATSLRNPLWLLKVAPLFNEYPQESFSALQDYPTDYLKRWDQLCEKAQHTGVAANDAHQNIGLVVRLVDGNKVRFEDGLGKKLFEVDADAAKDLLPARDGKKAGDILSQLRLDPYERSLRHVGTHLLMPEMTEKAVWEALEAGRAYVAFDWLADATGFDFIAVSGDRRHEMGSRLTFDRELKLGHPRRCP
jgi:hypothetical protein